MRRTNRSLIFIIAPRVLLLSIAPARGEDEVVTLASYNVEHFNSHFYAHELTQKLSKEKKDDADAKEMLFQLRKANDEDNWETAQVITDATCPRHSRHRGRLRPGRPRVLQQAVAPGRVRDRHPLPHQHRRPQPTPEHAAQARLQGAQTERPYYLEKDTVAHPGMRRRPGRRPPVRPRPGVRVGADAERLQVLGRRHPPEEQVDRLRQRAGGERSAKPTPASPRRRSTRRSRKPETPPARQRRSGGIARPNARMRS